MKTSSYASWLWSLWVLFLVVPKGLNAIEDGSLRLTILHTNDVHARFEQANAFGGPCSDSQAQTNKCYGGSARLKTKVTEIRDHESNVLFLDGGDYYQGSLLFTEYSYNVTSDFTNRLEYDAVALGNHEFDNGVEGLVPYLEKVRFPVLACNLDLSLEPSMQGKVNCSRIFDVAGQKVAVLGYLTPETKQLATTGNVIFLDEVTSLQAEVIRLQTRERVNKFIAVGHSGFVKDKDIARKVKGLDLVIGGHTNTFLYTGTPPTKDEKVMGPYPTKILQEDGTEVLVVQDYAYGKYLGYLKVHFDKDGKITNYSGNPILLDGSVDMDSEIVVALEPYIQGVEELTKQVVGLTYVLLRGDREKCRQEECNLGNFFTEACVQYLFKGPASDFKYNIAIWNSGALRASIDEQSKEGNVTTGDILVVAPFRNTMDGVALYGRDLKLVMEHSVSKYDVTGQDSPGAFLQMTGLQVTYDVSRPLGQRVVELWAMCNNCRVPKYKLVKDDQVYYVIVPSYILGGGDGYQVLKDKAFNVSNTGFLDSQVLIKHFRRTSPVTTGEDRRIRFTINQGTRTTCFSGLNYLMVIIFLILFLRIL